MFYFEHGRMGDIKGGANLDISTVCNSAVF